jgi:hypothetical protein
MFNHATVTNQEPGRHGMSVQAMWRRWLPLALLLLWAAYGALRSVPRWAWAPSSARAFTANELSSNCDLVLIFQGAREAPTLRDTLQWWHGVWIGQVPFWRPLTSLAFWSEIRLFGADRLDGWVWVSAALHVAVVCLAAALASRLTGRRWMGLVSAALVALSRSCLSVLARWEQERTGIDHVIANPALQEDLWMALPVLGAILCATSRRWLWALLLCGLAVSAKEMGWTAFALCFLAVWVTQGWAGVRAIPRWVWAAGGALVALLVLARWSAGPEVFRGFRMGTNHYWPMRLLVTSGGYWLKAAARSEWAPALGSALAFLAWLRWGRRGGGRWLAAAAVVSLCLATWAQMLSAEVPWDVALTQLLTVRQVVVTELLCLLSLAVLYAYLSERQDRALRLAVLAMYALTTAPYLAAIQVQMHALYLQGVFTTMMVPLSAAALYHCLLRRYGTPGTSAPASAPDTICAPR